MRWPWSRRKRRHDAPVPRHAASWAQPALPPVEPSVTLGFTDGSELALVEGDPSAMALQAVADVLLRQEPV
jgi:hypothetical protein